MMEKPLPFLSKSPAALPLLLRALVAILGAVLLVWGSFSFWAVILFLAIFWGLYLSEEGDRQSVRTSYFFIPALLVLGGWALPLEEFFSIPVLAVLGILVLGYLIVTLHGLARFLPEDRTRVYRMIHAVLLLLALILFAELVWQSVWWVAALFLILLPFHRESLHFSGIEPSRKTWAAGAVWSLIGAEILILGRFLPLGFLNMAAFAGLLLFLLGDLIVRYFRGDFTKKDVVRHVSAFVLVSLVIFAASSWDI